jgi:hypothetical protein
VRSSLSLARQVHTAGGAGDEARRRGDPAGPREAAGQGPACLICDLFPRRRSARLGPAGWWRLTAADPAGLAEGQAAPSQAVLAVCQVGVRERDSSGRRRGVETSGQCEDGLGEAASWSRPGGDLRNVASATCVARPIYLAVCMAGPRAGRDLQAADPAGPSVAGTRPRLAYFAPAWPRMGAWVAVERNLGGR